MSAYLEIDSLFAELPDRSPVLRGISMTAHVGEVHGLVGESGAGKSMIGKAVLGILPSAISISHVAILLDGENLEAMPPKRRWGSAGR